VGGEGDPLFPSSLIRPLVCSPVISIGGRVYWFHLYDLSNGPRSPVFVVCFMAMV
jgi:hypothetical protein